MTEKKEYDVIIIGGSYAGLSAAMALGRSLRDVLVIDSGLPCNRQTPLSHNFLTQDGEKPDVIAARAKEQVLRYNTVNLLNDFAESARLTGDSFAVSTRAKGDFKAKKLVLATGIKDTMPNIKGFAQCWGISLVHCPYCHGYEIRNKKTAILANGERAYHLASLVNNLTDNITLLTQGKPELKPEQLEKLEEHKINIIEMEVKEIEHQRGHLRKVIFKDGSKMEFDAAYASIPFKQHSEIPASLGCEITEQGYIKINEFHKTTVKGVYACGDNSSMMRSVANAVYSGNLTGAIINMELTGEKF